MFFITKLPDSIRTLPNNFIYLYRCSRRNQTFWKCPAGRSERRGEQGGPRKCLNIKKWLPLALPPLLFPVSSLPSWFQSSPTFTCKSVCPPCPFLPLPPLFSLCGKHLKKKKSRKNPSQTVWLKHFVSWCCYGEFFGNDDSIILGKFLHCIRIVWSARVCVCLPTTSALFLSLLPPLFSVPSVCAMLCSSEESKPIEWIKRGKKKEQTFFFSLFQCDDGMNYRRHNKQSKKREKGKTQNENTSPVCLIK